MNPYQTLQISPSSEWPEIKSAYRRLAKLYHPDVNKASNADQLFAALNTAFEEIKKTKTAQLKAQGPRIEERRQKQAIHGMKLYEFLSPGQKLIEISCGEHVMPGNSCIFLMFMGSEFRVRIPEERTVPFLLQVRNPEVLIRVVV